MKRVITLTCAAAAALLITSCGGSGSSGSDTEGLTAVDAMKQAEKSGLVVVPRKIPEGYTLRSIAFDGGPGTPKTTPEDSKRALYSYEGERGNFTMCMSKAEVFENYCLKDQKKQDGHPFAGDFGKGAQWATWGFPKDLAAEMKKTGPFDATGIWKNAKWIGIQSSKVTLDTGSK